VSASTTPDIDQWGRSRRARQLSSRVFDPIYRRWFRVEWEGRHHIPTDGAALLVANHAGVVPVDGALIIHGIERDLGRTVYGLHHDALRAVPLLGTAFARNGGVVANQTNADRLLREESALVLVFPEGTKGTTKLASERYRLQRFGRGGFIETALRAGVPVVPIAVMGSEETMPTVAAISAGPVKIPITLNAIVLGPAFAFVPLPAKIRIRVLTPIRLDGPCGLDHYPPDLIAEATDDIRDRIQTTLDQMRIERRAERPER
jgi:1-acyl-sn-glycerol-3-phosphate acyltransferase